MPSQIMPSNNIPTIYPHYVYIGTLWLNLRPTLLNAGGNVQSSGRGSIQDAALNGSTYTPLLWEKLWRAEVCARQCRPLPLPRRLQPLHEVAGSGRQRKSDCVSAVSMNFSI
jgi:hypothetical protein